MRMTVLLPVKMTNSLVLSRRRSWLQVLFFFILHASFSTASGVDQHSSCAEWAQAGECDANPGYMQHNCAASCEKENQMRLEADKELQNISSFYQLKAKDIDGNTVDFEDFRGKVVIITNVASYCGYTESHYKNLVTFYQEFKDKNVEILAFPCNQFGKQEPGTASEIKQFAQSKGVQFRMMQKVDVNGGTADIVYKYLKRASKSPHIQWNFETYFVVSPPNGEVQAFHGVLPTDLTSVTESLLSSMEEEL